MVAVPPDAHAVFLVYEVLPARLAGALEDDGRREFVIVARDNRGVFLVLLRQGLPLLPIGLLLGLVPLGRVPGALLTANVLATGTLGRGAESRVAPMTFAVDTHADRLLDTQNVAVGRVPLARLDL